MIRGSQIETRSGSSVACVVAAGLAALSNNFADIESVKNLVVQVRRMKGVHNV